MKKILLIVFLISTLTGVSQTFEEYRRQEQENFTKFKKQQEEALARMRKEYAEYVEKRDREFAAYLEQEWKARQTHAGIAPPERPKPTTPPAYKPVEVPAPERKTGDIKPLPVKKIQALPLPPPVPLISGPVRKPVAPEIRGEASETFRFYGIPVYINYDPSFKVSVAEQSGQRAVARYWKAASATPYTGAVEQLLAYREQMNLNDYAYFLLVRKFSESLYPGQAQGQVLATWFLMVRSGYGIRLGSDGHAILLLLPSRQMVYAKSYLTEDGMNYYLIDNPAGSQIKTYDNDYAGATRSIDFNIPSPIHMGNNTASCNIRFDFQGRSFDTKVAYNPNLVDLFRDYPQLDMQVYFDAAVSRQAKESLANSLTPLMTGMDEKQSVEFLLALVQHSFAYKTDPEQFGYEKFFFPEEVLHYPFSDCEDRSSLFAYLVRDLTGLDVVGLQYSDHMATAVKFNTSVTGDFVTKDGQKYIIADPTFIGAPLGRCMPEYLTEAPTLVAMNNPRREAGSNRNLWDMAAEGGCRPASNLPNLAILNNGNTILTGFYAGPSHFLGKELPEAKNGHACFVGQVKPGKKPAWAAALQATGPVAGLSVAADVEGNAYVAGSFRGKLLAGGFTLTAQNDAPDAFVAAFDPQGQLRWIRKLGLDSLPQGTALCFSATFTTQGKAVGLTFSLPDDSFEAYGIYATPTGKITFNGNTTRIFSSTPSITTSAFASAGLALTPDLIKNENDGLIAGKTDRGIAGILAVANLVYRMGYTFTGKDAQSALDKYNPGFSKRFPDTYKSLGKITFMKNANGIITLATEDGRDVLFDKVKVRNNASLTINPMPGGDMQFDILTGIRVGRAIVWYDLNLIRLYNESGDMLFDYDTDHTQKRLNLRRDFLK